MFAATSKHTFVSSLLLAISVFARAEPPKTPEEANEIVIRGKADPEVLWELKGASLDIIMPFVKNLWYASALAAKELEECRQGGNEKEYIASEKASGRDVVGLASRLPMMQSILMSDPNFEWTVTSKVRRITFDLDEHFRKWGSAPATDLVFELGFVSLIPGDAAIRIIGPSLEAPHFPPIDDGDVWITSPASRAREFLAREMKKRYGEKIPEDVEAARAWWKENEHRFAQKPSTPATPGTGNGALPQNNSSAAANGKLPSSQKASPATAQETDQTAEQSRTPLRWLTGTAFAAALAAAFILFARARK